MIGRHKGYLFFCKVYYVTWENAINRENMFELEKSFTFEAGHALKKYDGSCVRPHGHSYTLIVIVQGSLLQSTGPQSGMLIDFHAINTVVEPMLEKYLDHHWLNETLHTESPTAEYIAKWIFEYLQSRLFGLKRVTLYETATSAVSFFVE